MSLSVGVRSDAEKLVLDGPNGFKVVIVVSKPRHGSVGLLIQAPREITISREPLTDDARVRKA